MREDLTYRIKRRAKGFVIYVFLSIVAITCLFPLVWMFGSSLKTQSTVFSDMSIFPKSPQWINYFTAWTKGGFGTYFLNSLLYTTAVVFGIVIVSSLAAAVQSCVHPADDCHNAADLLWVHNS